jgi:signal transduction histidine kinase
VAGTLADETQLPPEHIAGRWALLQIIDGGQGVPEAYRTHIFELFGQAPNGRSRGNGIGLAFCKLAVGAHGGMIWVTDTENGGATFSFTLPLA